uniref:NADH dehydrogenase subunit 6 n=1 Tax=Sardinella aurita TaxID=196071 RepID=UPI0030FE3CE0
MSITFGLLLFGFVLGMVLVGSNPSPFYAAFGLVFCAGACCGVLALGGLPFLAMVLFLIYLGGMLVVFGFSVALAADAHPEGWGNASVFEYIVLYLLGVVAAALYVGPSAYELSGGVMSSVKELLITRPDMAGVAMLYALGGAMMLFCAWVLLLTLFVVLELTRGLCRGSLRAV